MRGSYTAVQYIRKPFHGDYRGLFAFLSETEMTRKLFAEYCICVFAVFDDEEKQRMRGGRREKWRREKEGAEKMD